MKSFFARELSGRNRAGALLAMLTCPCHAAMLMIVAAGTGLGSWLVAHRHLVYAAFTAAFAAGLWLLLRPARTCAACVVPSGRADAGSDAGAEESRPLAAVD